MATSWIRAAAAAAWPPLAPPTPLRPRAAYGELEPTSVLVLQAGPNASVDYYLRPRLEAGSLPWTIADLASDPAAVPEFRRHGLWVVVCRYVNAQWLAALKQAGSRLAGVSFFVDDDLPAMMTEPATALEARLKVSTRYGRFQADLEDVTSEVWASTPALARRFGRPVRLLPPTPCDPPQPPRADTPPLIVYHGTLTHDAERRFLHTVARRLEQSAVPHTLEVAGGLAARIGWAGRRHAVVRSQRPWPDYLREERARSAALLLAPLTTGAVNSARAAVKVFDAARLGAVGIYADRSPYNADVRDGVDGRLLPMEADIWADAITGLLTRPEMRLRIAQAAFERISAERAAVRGLFESLGG